jgi:hypothetical protein
MGRCDVTTCMVNTSNVTRCTVWQSSKNTEIPCVSDITQSTNLQLFRFYLATISVHRTYNRKSTILIFAPCILRLSLYYQQMHSLFSTVSTKTKLQIYFCTNSTK